MDGGSGYTAIQMYFMPMRDTLKTSYSAQFLCHAYFMAI